MQNAENSMVLLSKMMTFNSPVFRDVVWAADKCSATILLNYTLLIFINAENLIWENILATLAAYCCNVNSVIPPTSEDCKLWYVILARLKQNKLEPFLGTSQDHHLLWSGIKCQYSQTIVVVSTLTAQLSLLDYLPPLPLDYSEWTVFYRQRLLIKNIMN